MPLPDTAGALEDSARMGREIAALLDTETQFPGVTAGALRPEMKAIAVISKAGGGPLNPDAGDLALTAGWGYGDKDGVTMPGKGKAVQRDYTPEERAAIREGALALGLSPEQAFAHLRANAPGLPGRFTHINVACSASATGTTKAGTAFQIPTGRLPAGMLVRSMEVKKA